jgi:hypothetical protein
MKPTSTLRDSMTSSWLRNALAALVLVLAPALACGGPESLQPASTPKRPDSASVPGRPAATSKPGPAAPINEANALRARDDLPAERRALAFVNGTERWVDAEAIAAAGYTLIDLRDDWTPSIFAEERTPEGAPMPNRYRRVFIGMANDRLDNDGAPLPAGEKNYLELYGVFPSLSVLRARFVQDAAQPCHDEESVTVLNAIETVRYVPPKNIAREAQRLAWATKELETARKKAKVATLQDLATARPELAAKVALIAKRAAEKAAMTAVEKRLTCEKLFPKDSKHKTGIYDDAMTAAVRSFQQKHMIYEANFLHKRTVDALARPLLDNDYDGLVRTLRERVVSAAGIIEDGTGGSQKFPARNLVEEYTKTAVQQLGLTDAQAALAFFERHPAEHFLTLRAAVKLPERPEYYARHMDLSIVVDRGDVWYDLPFDKQGHFSPHPRQHYPHLTLFVTYQGEKIPLARWRTTIGGWRAEQAPDGYEYFRYKGSDVGARVIRQVVSGPVWIAPESTPIRSLIKGKVVNERPMAIVNYDELGPGYLSAYGLVAGYFVVPGLNGRPDWDNGVRAHGSSDYLSIYSANGFSHGCHRLPNHIAIRLYSFILGHRNGQVSGDQPFNFSRQFLKGNTVFEIRIASRGFVYTLDPPLPVHVLEGQIKGAQKTPIVGYVPKPDTQYPGPPPPAPDSAEARGGGG